MNHFKTVPRDTQEQMHISKHRAIAQVLRHCFLSAETRLQFWLALYEILSRKGAMHQRVFC
jgi:hypothetical protein